MKLAIGSDNKTDLTDALIARLQAEGHQISLFGPLADDAISWPLVAHQVALQVAEGNAEEGIIFCWTGTGVSIVANKVHGIRAAFCDDAETARGARLWNNANILCVSLRRTSQAIGGEILDNWFNTAYQPNEADDACLAAIDEIERQLG
jgi:ribose 5-phosphate isomerase B